MKQLFLVLFLLTALGIQAQRNVVLIIADDLGTDYCGFYEDHQDTVALPNIRSLLSKGIRFTDLMSNPVCSSTRSGIFTGRYSFRTGVGGIVGGAGGSNQLDTSELTIPRLLNLYNPNIVKAQIGKWHLHNPTPVSHLQYPNVMGYDHYAGEFIGALNSYYNWTKVTDGVSSTVTTYATTETANDAISWVKAQSNKPFFLWLGFNAPHTPYNLPPAGFYSDSTLSGTPQDINQRPKPYFKAVLEALDHELGRVFDSLKVINKYDSTDFIFIGDNGNTTRVAQITDTSKAKGTIYQYGVHVPLIISGPSVVSPGRVSNALVNTADIFATVLELMGDTSWRTHILTAKPVDSRSILPVILNQSNQIRPWAFTEIFKLTTDSADGKAMRNREYKLLNFDYGAQEFYDLTNDSAETHNLLLGTLTATEASNYAYLCNEMATLVGTSTFCKLATSIYDVTAFDLVSAYPNPFTSHIYLQSANGDEKAELRNALGQILYSGDQINRQDFSYLPQGLYFLSIHSTNCDRNLKLIHP